MTPIEPESAGHRLTTDAPSPGLTLAQCIYLMLAVLLVIAAALVILAIGYGGRHA